MAGRRLGWLLLVEVRPDRVCSRAFAVIEFFADGLPEHLAKNRKKPRRQRALPHGATLTVVKLIPQDLYVGMRLGFVPLQRQQFAGVVIDERTVVVFVQDADAAALLLQNKLSLPTREGVNPIHKSAQQCRVGGGFQTPALNLGEAGAVYREELVVLELSHAAAGKGADCIPQAVVHCLSLEG